FPELVVGVRTFDGEGNLSQVTQQIEERGVVADGMSFGDTGPYEKLRGTVHFEVDARDARNAAVFDLDKAPRTQNEVLRVHRGSELPARIHARTSTTPK